MSESRLQAIAERVTPLAGRRRAAVPPVASGDGVWLPFRSAPAGRPIGAADRLEALERLQGENGVGGCCRSPVPLTALTLPRRNGAGLICRFPNNPARRPDAYLPVLEMT